MDSELAEALGLDGTKPSAFGMNREALYRLTKAGILAETAELVVRLQVAAENLYQSYDRKRAEAELRLAVALPVFFVVVCIAVYEQQPWWMVLSAFPVALWWQGRTRREDAESDLIQMLTQAVIQTPFLERLEQAARRRHKQLEEESRKQGERDGSYTSPPGEVVMFENGMVGAVADGF